VDKHLSLSFLRCLSAGFWLLPIGERWGWDLSEVSFWVLDSWSVTLFWISLREFVFGSVGRPVGKTAASSPSWNYADPRVCKGAKTGLVWGFLNSILGLVLWQTGRLPNKCFSDKRFSIRSQPLLLCVSPVISELFISMTLP